MNRNSNINLTSDLIKKAIWGIVAIVVFTIGMAFIRPWYNVWSQEMEGKAEFAKAEQNRKIKIEEARANLEAEKLNAQAEIERAKGAAEAIKIEAQFKSSVATTSTANQRFYRHDRGRMECLTLHAVVP